MSSDSRFLSAYGKSFHSPGANDAKDLAPKVMRRLFGTCSKPLLADLKDLVGT